MGRTILTLSVDDGIEKELAALNAAVLKITDERRRWKKEAQAWKEEAEDNEDDALSADALGLQLAVSRVRVTNLVEILREAQPYLHDKLTGSTSGLEDRVAVVLSSVGT